MMTIFIFQVFLTTMGFSDKTEFPNNIIGGFVGFAHSRLSIRDIKMADISQ